MVIREDRLAILAQVCVDNGVTPDRGNYAGLIRKVCLSHLHTNECAAKELTRALATVYRTDKWSSLLNPIDETKGNCDFEPNRITLKMANKSQSQKTEETTTSVATTTSSQDRTELHTTMANLFVKTQDEPIKKVEVKQPTQQDRLTEKQIAQLLYATARRDTFDGVGRLILCDCRNLTDNKHLQLEDIITLWRRHYPLIDIEWRSNVILVYWEGKETVCNIRSAQAPIIPRKAPVFKPRNNPVGDIEEDTEGVVPEQEATT